MSATGWLIIEVIDRSLTSRKSQRRPGNEAKDERMSWFVCAEERRGMRVEWRLEGSGWKGCWLYINREHSQVSVIIFTKVFQCKTLCPVPGFQLEFRSTHLHS